MPVPAALSMCTAPARAARRQQPPRPRSRQDGIASRARTGHAAAAAAAVARKAVAIALTAVCAAVVAAVPAPAQAQVTRVNVATDGSQAAGDSLMGAISGNGRFVMFTSTANNLVAGDTSLGYDVFVRDLVGNATTRVSVATGGTQVDASSFGYGISDDGNVIVFETRGIFQAGAGGLCRAAGEPIDCSTIYTHDRSTGQTTAVSVSAGGAFANADSIRPSISGDGRYVAFVSQASNLVPGDSNTTWDIFVRDRLAGTITRVNVGPNGEEAGRPASEPVISGNGRVVAYLSAPDTFGPSTGGVCDGRPNCEQVFVRDLQAGTTRSIPWRGLASTGAPLLTTRQAALSADGRFLAVLAYAHAETLADPSLGTPLAEIHDLFTGAVFEGRTGGMLAISDDGRYLASTRRVVAPGGSGGLDLSDRATGQYEQTLAGGDEFSWPSIDSSARWVAFGTRASTLVPGDTNGYGDIFLLDRDPDGDGMLSEWERLWNLDPDNPADATEDPDGDGLTNLQEFRANAHPRAPHTRYFSEGAANGFFTTQIALLNPSATASRVLLRLLGPGGVITTQTHTVPASARATALLKYGSEIPDATFGIIVESEQPIVADRLMRWNVAASENGRSGYGSSLETATEAPGRDWFFAEGATGTFSLYYLLQNPGDAPAFVRIDYLRNDGLPVISLPYTVDPHSRLSIDVAAEHPGLLQAEVSAKLNSSQPIVAERAMYRSAPDELFAAGHAGAAVKEPALRWFLAEGATGFFDEYVLIANAEADAAQLDVTFMPEGGTAFTERINVAAHSRYTLEPKTRPALAAVPLSIGVRSINDVPVVVERAMWWPAGAWYEASLSAGVTGAGTKWAIAEAGAMPEDGLQTYVLVANVDPVNDARVKVTFLDAAGDASKSTTVIVAKNGRYTVDISGLDPAVRPAGLFGVLVDSLDGVPIVVERSLYESTATRQWNSGGTSVATNLAPVP